MHRRFLDSSLIIPYGYINPEQTRFVVPTSVLTEPPMSWFLFSAFLVLTTLAKPLLAEGETREAPDGWRFVTVRAETACVGSVVSDAGTYGLVIAGNGETICDGRWVRTVHVPTAPCVRFTARYRASDVEMPARNVIAALVWLDENGKE